MVNALFLPGSQETTVYGLTQWDFGQDLVIAAEYLPDGTEVNFYQGGLSAIRYIKNKTVRIPDRMLQDTAQMKAYVYCRTESAGETVLFINLPIRARPRPSDYIIEDTDEYRRILPAGGRKGQVLKKTSDKDYTADWGDAADDMRLEAGMLQLLSGGREIGTKIRIPSVEDMGREIELTNDGTAVKWRYTNSNDWKMLIRLEDLKGETGEQGPPGRDGKDGITPEFEIRAGHLIAKYEE